MESAAYSRDGRRIITCGWDRTARIWDTASATSGASEHARELVVLRGHSRGVTSADFSPDGQRIVTGSWDGTTRLWNAATGDNLLTIKEGGGGVFSPDGRRLVIGNRVWEIASPEQIAAWEAEEAAADAHRASAGRAPEQRPDGRRTQAGMASKQSSAGR
jgi:WD40 repeat protein